MFSTKKNIFLCSSHFYKYGEQFLYDSNESLFWEIVDAFHFNTIRSVERIRRINNRLLTICSLLIRFFSLSMQSIFLDTAIGHQIVAESFNALYRDLRIIVPGINSVYFDGYFAKKADKKHSQVFKVFSLLIR